MDERIKELVQQTDVWCDQNYAGDKFYDVRWEEKFAELIVRECAVIATINSHQNESAGFYVLKHFGVE